MKRILVISSVIIILLVVLSSCWIGKPPSDIPPPDEVRYMVVGEDRNYYTNEYEVQGCILVLHGYYTSLYGASNPFNDVDLHVILSHVTWIEDRTTGERVLE